MSTFLRRPARPRERPTRRFAQSEESRKQAEAVSNFLVEAFRSLDPSRDNRQVEVADVPGRSVRKLDERFADSQATVGAMLDALGGT